MKKRTRVFLVLLNNNVLIIVCVKNPKHLTFHIFLGEKIFIMFYEISFCSVLEYYSIMIHSKCQSILPKNGQENGTET